MNDTPSSRTLGAGLLVLGGLLTASSAATAVAAADHMARVVSLCGPVVGHCVLCVLAATSLLASAGVVAAGLALMKPRPAPRTSKS